VQRILKLLQQSDGGVEINFDPGAFSQGESVNHFDNLAELLPENILGQLGSELYQNFLDYKNSRQDWEQTYTQGLDLLGFKYDQRTEPFPRCIRCNTSCSCRSSYTISSISLQRIITSRWTCANSNYWKHK
jgi:hypothetical protein